MADTRRIRLTVAYDGTAYAGYQRQAGHRSVQQALEDALGKLSGVPRVVIHGASRTDAGVHALGQVVHFDTSGRIPAEKYGFALNTLLPGDVRVMASCEVSPDFHARFSATGKTYRYLVDNGRHFCPLRRLTHAHVPIPLDLAAMRGEAQTVVGRHDFRAFAAAGSVAKTTVRTIHRVRLEQEGACFCLYVHGNAFLYNMVRILAGTLIDVGRGNAAPGAIARALETGDRLALGVTAPAQGLTLMAVYYDDDERAQMYFD